MTFDSNGDRSRWTCFNNWNPRGPYLVLINDCDWWEENRDEIDGWFDRNCPVCKPERNDTIITFGSQQQYTMWRMAWGD